MTKLRNVASYIDHDGIGKVLRLCEDQSLARADLPRQIERLKKLSLDCVENTAGIQQRFETWAHFAQVLRRACHSSQDNARKASGTLTDKRFGKQNASANQERKLKEAKQSLSNQQRKLQDSERRMDRAQREIPKGGKAVGIRAADGIMNGLSTLGESITAVASALTSVVASGGPTLTLKMTSEETTTAQSASSAQAAATAAVAAATAKAERKKKKDTLRQAREDYEGCKRDFLEREKVFVELEKQDQEAKDQFNDIQLQLQQLGQQQISIEETEVILSRCVNNLNEFQDHIIHIRRFFTQIHEHVTTIDSTYLADFVHSADKLAQLPSTSSEREDHQRTQRYFLEEISNDATKLRESYIAAGEFASTYIKVSEKYIWPGVQEVNRLMLQNSRDNGIDVRAKVKVINRYARNAQSEISKIATERREAVRNKLWDTKRPLEDLGEVIGQYGDLGEEDDDGEDGVAVEGEEPGTIDEEQTLEVDDVDAVSGGQEDEEDEDDEWDNA